MVISQDKEKGRFSLSTKSLEPEPGDMVRNPQAVFDQVCFPPLPGRGVHNAYTTTSGPILAIVSFLCFPLWNHRVDMRVRCCAG
jgi:hypothetical protein